jgi:hypothetical protein
MKWLSALVFLLLLSIPFSTAGQTRKVKQESCDGALDVVPSKSATFQRKRRPANAPPQAVNTNHTPRKKTGK